MSVVSRRRVVATSAWAVPAVAVTTGAPAYAATAKALTFHPGATRVTRNEFDGLFFNDLTFDGASVEVEGTPDSGAQLTLTVTFTPYPNSPQATGELWYIAGIPGWAGPPVETSATTATYTYTDPVANGTTVKIPGGTYFGTSYSDEWGTFLLTFALPSLTPDSETFATPPAPPGPAGATASARGARRSERAAS